MKRDNFCFPVALVEEKKIDQILDFVSLDKSFCSPTLVQTDGVTASKKRFYARKGISA